MTSDKLALALQKSSPMEREAIELCVSKLNTVLDLIIEKVQPQVKDIHLEPLINDKDTDVVHDSTNERQPTVDINNVDSYCEKLVVDNHLNSVNSGYYNYSYGETQMVDNYVVNSNSGDCVYWDMDNHCVNQSLSTTDVNNDCSYGEKSMVDNYGVYTSDFEKHQGQLNVDPHIDLMKDSYCEKLVVDNQSFDSEYGEVPVNNDDICLFDVTKKACENNLMGLNCINDKHPAESENSSSDSDSISETVDPPHIRLTQIQDSINYFDQNGYVYSINNNNRGLKSLYFRCKNSSGMYQCTARAIARNKNLENAKLTKPHCNHEPDQPELQKIIFDKKLDKICQENEYMPRREIYFKAREQVHPDDVTSIPLRTSYGSFFSRRKSKVKPKNPKTIEEFEELINNEKFQKRYCFDSDNLQFYRGVWTDKNGNKMVVFISETGLQHLRTLQEIEFLMDGTFKVLPRHIQFCQLYIISFMYEERCYPFAFIFMEKRDAAAYDLLFDELMSMMGEECVKKVKHCMSDYEAAVRKILRERFPHARISGCFFHYVKAIHKQTRRFGLAKQEEFQQPIRELCALALLPNEFVDEGFDVIDDKIADTDRWIRFRSYWLRQWKPSNISVYGLKNRTDNFSEAFNRSFNLLNGKPHQNIWVVLKNLKHMEMDKRDQLKHQVGGKMFNKRPPKKDKKGFERKIQEATDRFDENEDVARFLQHITYDKSIQTACKQCHLFEKEDDENEIDEFIPNDFDVNSNFTKKTKKSQVNRKRKAETNQKSGKNVIVKGLKKPRLVRKITDKKSSIKLWQDAEMNQKSGLKKKGVKTIKN